MRYRISSLVLSVLAAAALCQAGDSSHRQWEKEIQAFEASDRTNPPPAHAILFVGSSSIRLWKTLAEDFPGLPVINRGFGGSQMADCLYYADRIVLPYRPREVVVYEGDNDLAAGKTPEQVASDFEALVRKLRPTLPEARICYISIKPSPARSNLIGKMQEANRLIARYARDTGGVEFVDVFTPMLNQDGQPRPELFAPDKLHLNRAGYQLWSARLRPYLVP